MGPKVTGTTANEVEAAGYIRKQLLNIKSKANPIQNISVDHQITSGSYHLGWKPYSMINAYRNIQNLVVRIEGETPNAIMLNCHFDSVPGSPGAADDTANCAILMELVSIYSRKDKLNRHTLIFLFNGAEEIGLRASHGFITQHEWAKDIRLFINLEAAGSGGKETLFQTGPGNSWLLNHYKAVARPFAQVVGEEIFQSGLIPSDTDFRIFRDFGKVPGLDFAHGSKGYRYHTKFDSIDFLSLGVLQRTGENILGLVDSIVNSHELDDITKYSDDSSSAVYFDFLGFFFVYYPKDVGVVINFVVVLSAITLPFLTLTTVKTHTRNVLSETLIGFFGVVIGTGCSGLWLYLTAYFIDKHDHSMSWNRSTFLAPGIYSSLAVLIHVIEQDLMNLTVASRESPLSLGLRVQARLNGVNVFWGVITLTITLCGYRFGYLTMILILFNLITNVILMFCKLHNSVDKWLRVFMIGQFFSILWSSYAHNMVMEIFIPITGRSGAMKNPDILIAMILCTTTILICSYMVSGRKLFQNFIYLINVSFVINLDSLGSTSEIKSDGLSDAYWNFLDLNFPRYIY